jgi:hypothetical protein
MKQIKFRFFKNGYLKFTRRGRTLREACSNWEIVSMEEGKAIVITSTMEYEVFWKYSSVDENNK